MTSAMTAVGILIGGTSLACYLLRSGKRRASRGLSRDGSEPDGGSYLESSNGSILSWFAGGRSAVDSSGMSTAAGAIVEVAVMGAAQTVAAGAIEVSVAERAAF